MLLPTRDEIFLYEALWRAEQTQIEFVEREKRLIEEKIALTGGEMTLLTPSKGESR